MKLFEKIIDELKQESIIVDDDAGHRAVEIIHQIAEEYSNGWIPCSERLPEEHDSIFAKYKGTDMWNNAMFEKVSDVVNVTIVDKYGQCRTTYAYTTDGKWSCDLLMLSKTYKIIAWQPLPAPYSEKSGDCPDCPNCICLHCTNNDCFVSMCKGAAVEPEYYEKAIESCFKRECEGSIL